MSTRNRSAAARSNPGTDELMDEIREIRQDLRAVLISTTTATNALIAMRERQLQQQQPHGLN
jgi:N-methylhydantoinase A/oxoprolinase/acetone carboxylase beta subunit